MPAPRAPWRQLARTLSALNATARVHGSRGWELVSALPCTHAQSDVDLWVAVHGAAHADAVAAALVAFGGTGLPRLDGELVFRDGRAMAWREWLAWRAGRCRAMLAKSLAGAELVPADGSTAQAAPW